MKFFKLFTIFSFLSGVTLLNAKSIICTDIYTTITKKKGTKPYKVHGSKGNGKTKITIEFEKKHIYLIGTYKTELTYIGKGASNIYLLEQTSSGNINLFSLFSDNTLTISKSYDMLGVVNMNVQSIYKCIEKNKNIPKIKYLKSFDFSLQPGIGSRRNPYIGKEFNDKMSSFLDKIIYLSIFIPKEIYRDTLQKRDTYGRIIFTVQNNLDDFGDGGSEYLIHLMPNDPDPFVFMGNIAILQGYYKVYDINGPRQGYMSINIRPARNIN
jgi:hypothetical protein